MNCPNCNYHHSSTPLHCHCGEKIGKAKPKPKGIRRRSDKNKEALAREIAMMKSIWAKYPHISEVSGEYLGDTFDPCFFMHVLPKKNYGYWRDKPINTVLGTFDEHYKLDHQTDRAAKDPQFRFIFELRAVLHKRDLTK